MQLAPGMKREGGVRIPYHSLRGELKFRDVSFTYPTRPNQTVLQDFNFTIPAGKIVALCGLSGGGRHLHGCCPQKPGIAAVILKWISLKLSPKCVREIIFCLCDFSRV